MVISNVNNEHLIMALAEVNSYYDYNICFAYSPEPLNKKHTRFRLRLRTHSARRDKNGDYPMGCVVRESRGVAAACWHATRDFFTALYEVNPHAKIKTAVATYNDVHDFEGKFPSTGYKLQYNQACRCFS